MNKQDAAVSVPRQVAQGMETAALIVDGLRDRYTHPIALAALGLAADSIREAAAEELESGRS